MTLSALIRKRDTGNLATAIPAISATQPKGEAGTVARIATVAVANPKEEKTAPPKVGAGDTATISRWWLIHYPDRDPVEVSCTPDATHADILERHPDAVAAEPFTPTIRQASAPLTAREETAIRAWLAHIEETDADIIAEVLNQCRADAEARAYFLRRAEEVPQPVPDEDDRQHCAQCANHAPSGLCLAARQNGEVAMQQSNRWHGYEWTAEGTLEAWGCIFRETQEMKR